MRARHPTRRRRARRPLRYGRGATRQRRRGLGVTLPLLRLLLVQLSGQAEVQLRLSPRGAGSTPSYGLRRFREYGAVIITCINREYAKKLVVQLPRQKHPYHFHKQKEETFQLIAGALEIVKDGEPHSMKPGDTLLVAPNEWHKFHTLDGCIVEEVSTTHHNSDSFYEDPAIARLDRAQRKTGVDNWRTYFRARHNL